MFKAHRLLYHSTLGLRAIKKKKKLTPQGTCSTPSRRTTLHPSPADMVPRWARI